MNIEKSRIFDSSLDHSFDCLLKSFSDLQISIESHSADSRTVKGKWPLNPVAPQYMIVAVCNPTNMNSTSIEITYDSTFTPWFRRTINPMVETSDVIAKMNQIFDNLAQCLGSSPIPNQPIAMKIESRRNKLQGFEWVFLILIMIPVLLVMHILGGASRNALCINIFLDFGLGAGIFVIYYNVTRIMLIHKFPDLFAETICSNCRTVVSKEAAKCSKCGIQFGEERDTEESISRFKCKRCGYVNIEESSFCSECGEKLDDG